MSQEAMSTPRPLLAARQRVPGEIARFQALAGGGYRAAAVFHILFLLAFLQLGEVALALFNIVSIACYVLCLRLLLRGDLGASMLLATIEVSVHQTWVVSVFGLGSGFQYYLLVLPFACVLIPAWPLWQRVLLAAAPLLVLLALLFAGQTHAPPRPLPDGWQQLFLLVNVTGLVLVQIIVVIAYANAARVAEHALEEAYSESESLLSRILPASIATRLKQRPDAVADRFDEVTVIFADLVGFTALAEQRTPSNLVVLLDRLIGEFDRLAAEFGVEKIKTLGDAWMGVAGAPEPQADHASRAADFALAILASVARLNDETGEDLKLRIGMASGGVVAGVIGRDKFAYDLWGDTVNLAARMESAGLTGEIQVSEATFDKLEAGYVLASRGAVEVKGKGPVRTWLLQGRRAARS